MVETTKETLLTRFHYRSVDFQKSPNERPTSAVTDQTENKTAAGTQTETDDQDDRPDLLHIIPVLLVPHLIVLDLPCADFRTIATDQTLILLSTRTVHREIETTITFL